MAGVLKITKYTKKEKINKTDTKPPKLNISIRHISGEVSESSGICIYEGDGLTLNKKSREC